MKYDLLLCGVGGQGIITLSEIIATAALNKGIKTIVTQEKGLAQRGGSVQAHIRLGEVFSPTMPKRAADGFISLELNETFGYLDFLNSETMSAVSDTVIASGETDTKDKNKIEEPEKLIRLTSEKLLSKLGPNTIIVAAKKKAIDLGVPRGVNIFMIGVLSGMDSDLSVLIDRSDLETAIKAVVRHNLDDNMKVFNKGVDYGKTWKSKHTDSTGKA